MFRGVPRAGVTLAPDWGATTSCEASCCSNEPAVRLELQIAAPIKAESSADLIKRSLVLDDARWLGVVALPRDPRTRPLKIGGEQLSDRGTGSQNNDVSVAAERDSPAAFADPAGG